MIEQDNDVYILQVTEYHLKVDISYIYIYPRVLYKVKTIATLITLLKNKLAIFYLPLLHSILIHTHTLF